MWTSNKMIALYIAVGVAAILTVAWFTLRKTVRTRLRMKRIIRDDKDINDWLIIFNWTAKVLYVPTMAASILAALFMWLSFGYIKPGLIGGIWFAIVFLNLLEKMQNRLAALRKIHLGIKVHIYIVVVTE